MHHGLSLPCRRGSPTYPLDLTVALSALLSATMGAAFFILPLVMLVASAIFVSMRFRKAKREGFDKKKEWIAIKPALRDPVSVGTMLLLSGFIVVSFITGRLVLSDYSQLISDAFVAYWDAVTDWEDPLSSSSISFKGGVLVVFMSAAVVAHALNGHFRTRWEMADRTHQKERLG